MFVFFLSENDGTANYCASFPNCVMFSFFNILSFHPLKRNSKQLLLAGPPPVTCPVLTVTNADLADCNGDYSVTEERVAWAGDRPVYAHADKDRYLLTGCDADM